MPTPSTEKIRPFVPPGLLKNPHVQSVLTSSPWRRWKVLRKSADYRVRSTEEIITTPENVRLLGFRNEPVQARSDDLAILLHGWEGSADSNYLLDASLALDSAGMRTFRLNFRDHGDSHHLNEDLFHSCRLEEVLQAVGVIAEQHLQQYPDAAVYLVGFSLGGNFALRIARQAPTHGIQLDHVIAVSPVIRPSNVLAAMEEGLPVYEKYFVRKWRRSLRRKQELFPERYNLDEWFEQHKLSEQTRHLVEAYTDFEHLDAYLEGYSIAGDYLQGLSVATEVITAADDPIIPVSDFHNLPKSDALNLEIWPHGGHCGFIENWRFKSWIADRIVSELCQK